MTTVEEAEQAWLDAMSADTRDDLAALLHPDFRAVHGPVGFIHDQQRFLADAEGRPAAKSVRAIESEIRTFGDTAVVSCLQEMHIAFVPDLAPFVIQAAVTRVWVREGQSWKLAHLQMCRRVPPG